MTEDRLPLNAFLDGRKGRSAMPTRDAASEARFEGVSPAPNRPPTPICARSDCPPRTLLLNLVRADDELSEHDANDGGKKS